jgi:hypothetical protein
VQEAFAHRGIELLAVSALTGEGMKELIWQLVRILEARKPEAVEEKTTERTW